MHTVQAPVVEFAAQGLTQVHEQLELKVPPFWQAWQLQVEQSEELTVPLPLHLAAEAAATLQTVQVPLAEFVDQN